MKATTWLNRRSLIVKSIRDLNILQQAVSSFDALYLLMNNSGAPGAPMHVYNSF